MARPAKAALGNHQAPVQQWIVGGPLYNSNEETGMHGLIICHEAVFKLIQFALAAIPADTAACSDEGSMRCIREDCSN